MTADLHRFESLVHAIQAVFDRVEVAGADPDGGPDPEGRLAVLVTTEIAGHTARIAIECREGRRRDQLAWVTSNHAHGEVLVDKIVLVSQQPFSAMAIATAARRGLELHMLEDALLDPAWATKLATALFIPYIERARIALSFELADPHLARVRGDVPDAIVGADALGLAVQTAWKRVRDQDPRFASSRTSLVDMATRVRVRFGLPPTLPIGVEYRVADTAVELARVSADVTWWREAVIREDARPLVMAAGIPATAPMRAITDVRCALFDAGLRVTIEDDGEGQRVRVYPARPL